MEGLLTTSKNKITSIHCNFLCTNCSKRPGHKISGEGLGRDRERIGRGREKMSQGWGGGWGGIRRETREGRRRGQAEKGGEDKAYRMLWLKDGLHE